VRRSLNCFLSRKTRTQVGPWWVMVKAIVSTAKSWIGAMKRDRPSTSSAL
jgi:hypothetical protein